MNLEQRIEEICTKAIELPECPVKRKHAVARRIWLKQQIIELMAEKPGINREMKPLEPREQTKDYHLPPTTHM